jgi:3-dehydroquinate synthetase
VDPGLLETLDARQVASGFAELVKTAVLFDPKLFELLESRAESLKELQEPALSRAIAASLAHKAKAVMEDEFDRHGKRLLLNLGHTFGHAIEAASHLQLLHGEAVAIGLCCAIDLSAKLGLAEPELMRIPPLLERLGLPISLKRQSLEPLMRALREDKKFEGGMRFVLPRRLGRSEIRELKDSKLVERIFQARFEL